jgi:hypothetical protein
VRDCINQDKSSERSPRKCPSPLKERGKGEIDTMKGNTGMKTGISHDGICAIVIIIIG